MGDKKKEILNILSYYEYGFTPAYTGKTVGNVIDCNYKCASGHGVLEKTEIMFPTPNGDFSFPVNYFRPNDHKKHDTFVLMNFRPDPYDMYVPVEEIIDNGFGVAVICYKDITSEDGDFSDKLSGFYPRKNDGTDWGKIGMWAFAMSRAADCLLTRNEVSGLIPIGHSRLGKTALWCGAQDGAQAPNYKRISEFRSERLPYCSEELFYGLVNKLKSIKEIEYEHLFVDGTKLEANANKYTFVWKKSTTKYETRLLNKLEKRTAEICNTMKSLMNIPVRTAKS